MYEGNTKSILFLSRWIQKSVAMGAYALDDNINQTVYHVCCVKVVFLSWYVEKYVYNWGGKS